MNTPFDDSCASWYASAPAAEPDVEVLVEEDIDEEAEERFDEPWKVILYNDDIHSFEEVTLQIIKATGCSTADAVRIMLTAHLKGKALAYTGTFDECFRVNGVLREIQLITEIEG